MWIILGVVVSLLIIAIIGKCLSDTIWLYDFNINT